MSDENVQVQITGDSSGAEAAADRARASIQRLTESFEGVGDAVKSIEGNLKTAFEATGIALAAEAFSKLRDAMDESAASAARLRNAAAIIGINTTQLQGLRSAAEQAGVGSQVLDRGLEMLGLRMQQARDGGTQMQERLAAVGITLADLRNGSFTAEDALFKMGNSGATTGEKMAVLGRFGLQLIPVLEQLKGGEADVAAEAARVGALTDEQIGILAAYHAQVTQVSETWRNFKDGVLATLAPQLGDLLERFTEFFGVINTGGRQTDEFREKMVAVEGEFLKWAAAAKLAYLDITHIFETIGVSLGNLGAVIAAAATGHFSRAKEIWNEGSADLLAIDQKHAADVLKVEEDLNTAIAKSQQKRFQGQIADVGGPKPDQAVVNKEPLIRESERYAELEIRRANEILDAMKKTAQEELAAAEETAIGKIAASEKALQGELRAGQVSAAQFLAQEKNLIAQKLQAQLDYYAQLEQLAAGDEAALAKIDKEIAKAHAEALGQTQAAENTAQQAQLAQWKQLGTAIESSFTSSIKGMLEGTKSFRDAVRSVFASLIDGIIQIFVKMAVRWAENMILQKVLGKQAALSQILANAGIAATAAMASVAAIPFYGWAAAPAVGAATQAEAMGYTADLSAAGGFDVPQNINPVTQLHGGEMVLPRGIADPLREMLAGGGGTSEQHNYNGNVKISALDAGSFARMMNRPANRRALANAVRQHVLRGGR